MKCNITNSFNSDGVEVWGEGQRRKGATQGDPEAGTYLCAALHPQIRAGPGIYVGPPETVISALAQLGGEDLFHMS